MPRFDKINARGSILSEVFNGATAADVGWYSSERFESVKGQTVFERAPEICVEILSPDNSDREM